MRCGLAPALLSLLLSGCGAPPPRPDIVLVSIDSLRRDHLGSYGHRRDTSPTIDALAAEGVRFDDAVTSTSWTLPSHAGLFTGLSDSAHGLVRDGLALGEVHTTLAEVLRDAGYQTAGFFGGPYLHPSFGLSQGFETYQSVMTRIPDEMGAADVQVRAFHGVKSSHLDITGERTLTEVERWLEGVGEAPLFLFVHLWDVHYDYIPPQRWVEAFDPDYAGDLDATDFLANPAIHRDMPRRDLRHLKALYDGEIRATDAVLAAILERLERRGRGDALIVVTADHGDEFFEHGEKGHRRTLYEEVVRVPLVMRWPGRIEAGGVVEDQVRLIDVMPTVLALAGVPAPEPLLGRDLTPLLAGRSLAAEGALLELQTETELVQALRLDGVKLVRDADGSFHYFDLVRDPQERRPRPADGPEFERHRARFRELVEASRRIRDQKGPDAVGPTALAPYARERLEALGYLEPVD